MIQTLVINAQIDLNQIASTKSVLPVSFTFQAAYPQATQIPEFVTLFARSLIYCETESLRST